METEDIQIKDLFSVKEDDTQTQIKMAFIKAEEHEDERIEETCSMKQEDTETQTDMVFIKDESENIQIEDVFSITYEDTKTRTSIREKNQDTKTEASMREKRERTKTQTSMREKREETKTPTSIREKNEGTKTQTSIKEKREDTKKKKPFRVKHKDAETQTDCPICTRTYSRLSQHLRLTHKERKLLLAISSGRVDVRKGTCPLPNCGKLISRMDRHLMGHTELTASARQETIQALKRSKIMHDLSELRATNPTVPMASTLDQEDSYNDTLTLEEEEWDCDNPRCQKLSNEVADLNRQVDTLSKDLKDMTRRYCLLRRRLRPTPSIQVTGRMLLHFDLLKRQWRRSMRSFVLGSRGNQLARAPENIPQQQCHLRNKRSTPSSTMCQL